MSCDSTYKTVIGVLRCQLVRENHPEHHQWRRPFKSGDATMIINWRDQPSVEHRECVSR